MQNTTKIYLILLAMLSIVYRTIGQERIVFYSNDTMQIIQDGYPSNEKNNYSGKIFLYDVSKGHKNDTIVAQCPVVSLKCDGKHMSIVTENSFFGARIFNLKVKTSKGWTILEADGGGSFYDRNTTYDLKHTGLFSYEEICDRTRESQALIEKRKVPREVHNRCVFDVVQRKIIKYPLNKDGSRSSTTPIEKPFPDYSESYIDYGKSLFNKQKYY